MTTPDSQDPGRLSEGEVEVRAVAVERLTFFADAVIAIAITLLALDLPLPHGTTNAEFWRSVLDQRDSYLAFAISFYVISAHWQGHHRVFRYVTYLDGRLTGLTLGWLFTQVVIPFATRVIVGDGAFQSRFGFYAVVQLASFAMFTLIMREVETHRLYRADTPVNLFRHAYLQETGMAAGFLISIPVSFFTGWAYVCWVAGPLVASVIRRVRHAAG
ncbi:MAG TPA: TMEM175 family protein [Pseudonocardiaceae bacterium]|jgi:uncharacterized membrane protein